MQLFSPRRQHILPQASDPKKTKHKRKKVKMAIWKYYIPRTARSSVSAVST
jgi:hypothetical protein